MNISVLKMIIKFVTLCTSIIVVSIGVLLIIMIMIIFCKMLKDEFIIMRKGNKIKAKIIDVGCYDDHETLYNAQLTLMDENGNISIARMIHGVLYDSPKECWKAGEVVNAKTYGGYSVLE